MSEQSNKGKEPDFKVYLVQENKKGSEKWTDVGSAWSGKKGYINLETVAGKVVLQPRAELERMRTEQQESHTQKQDHNPTENI